MSDMPEKDDTQPTVPIDENDSGAKFDVLPELPQAGDPADSTQPVRPRQSGGCGCWIGALLTIFVVAILVIVGLFLPPINLFDRFFGVPKTALDATNNAIRSADGQFTLAVDPADTGNGFRVGLDSVSLEDFVSGNRQVADWIPNALGAQPPYLALQSAVYSIETEGRSPDILTLNLTASPGGASLDLLDLYGWDGQTWRFIPSSINRDSTITAQVSDIPDRVALFQATPLNPVLLVSVDITQNLSEAVGQLGTIIAPAGLQPTLEGSLTGSLAPGFDLNAGYLVMPVVRNFSDPRALDPDTVTVILGNSALRREHVRQITAVASSGGYDGILLDYRGLTPDQRENFNTFVSELGESMRNVGLLVGAVIPAADNVEGAWETGAYDWRTIGEAVDYLQIDLGLNPGTFEPGENRLVESMLRWAVGEVNRYKLLLGLSAQSVREAGGDFTPIGYDEALSALGDVTYEAETSATGSVRPGAEIRARLDGMRAISGMDTRIQTPFVEYQNSDGTKVATMWLTTGDALRFRMDRTVPFALGGVAFEDLLTNDIANDVLDTILVYKAQVPGAPAQTELALRWQIESASGLIDEVTTGLNDDLVVTVDALDGNYAINVAVVGPKAESPREGVAVAIFAPTTTPTPLPTLTPTPRPTATATPAPIIATRTPQPGQISVDAGLNPAPPAPGSGSIAAGFEYGGHVSSTASERAAGAMSSAGMTWMKVQVRYFPNADPGIAAADINNAHGRGYKILLGIVGDPNALAAGGAGYVTSFASFLGGVAALGPDAIEVWNEQNLDREWPRDQISAAAYTDMLRQSYTAIKNTNGNVMVISGALAPTGAEEAFPGQVVNDDRYLTEMVAAGALQYADCLGAHYNEGIVGPNQTSGDPRDNYYTRYFWGMINTYWAISGGQRPICFTELGYLSPEGFPPLSSFWGWAQNVTIAQQAAWLAQAAALSSTSGKVRLMIVWNVDFTAYSDGDPQAGYAMIRPNGSCPACGAMSGAR